MTVSPWDGRKSQNHAHDIVSKNSLGYFDVRLSYMVQFTKHASRGWLLLDAKATIHMSTQ
jgi:hypothetical protein